jgi:GNAT superfamily N-acetyltransferase
MKIQPLQDTNEDYAALVDLRRLLEPEDQLTIDLLRDEDREFAAENQVVRVLGKLDNQLIASGVCWHSSLSANEPFHFSFHVHPDYQNGSVPGQMQGYLLSRIERSQPAAIVSEAKENELYRTRLLEDSNFELKMRLPRSQLDVIRFDTAAYNDLMAQLVHQGFEFITLTDALKRDSNWQKNVWQMFTIIELDVPTPDPVQTTPFEEYARYYEGELFRPDSWAIALDSTQEGAQRYVGLCVVNMMPARPDTLFAGITGVVPTHRRRKIATILKVCSVKYARQHGYRYIYTDNEENNPMYTLNLRLGFEPLPAWVYYKKQIR